MNMATKKAAACILLAVLLGSAALITASTANAATSVDIRIGVPPPELRHEFVPRPRHGHIWVAGYWGWNGYAYEWIPGHWERIRRGYRYVAPFWQPYQNQWIFHPGHWEPAGPPPVIVQPPPPPVYVERPREPQAEPQHKPGLWYYCRNPQGYYPDVKECPGGWQAVEPQPSAPKQ
jgi:hypothetical protein